MPYHINPMAKGKGRKREYIYSTGEKSDKSVDFHLRIFDGVIGEFVVLEMDISESWEWCLERND